MKSLVRTSFLDTRPKTEFMTGLAGQPSNEREKLFYITKCLLKSVTGDLLSKYWIVFVGVESIHSNIKVKDSQM